MYSSLTEFVDQLERAGELVRVSVPVDTELEISEIVDRVSKSAEGGKAILFENTSTSFPLLINMMGSERRICMALGIERLEHLTERIDGLLRMTTAPKDAIMDKLRMLPMLVEMSQWLPRTSKGRGVSQQVVLRGDDVDLSKLPILKCWSCDGGRFITLPMVNTVDPDSGARNVGMYRMQVLSRDTTGMHWHKHKTGARHYEEYKRRGEKMPVSIALGGDPAYTYAATAPMPDNMDEYLLAGFLRRKRVKLVKSITNDIYVPADCDFVIEGYVDPAEERVVEGPFGDHTGFYSLQDHYPRLHVTAITHRRGAIYPATIVGVPPQEDAYIAMATERIFLSPIRFALQPEVRQMVMPTAGTAHNLAIISIEKRYEGQGNKVIQSMWGAGQMMFNKYLIVTSSNVDVRDNDALAALLRGADLRERVVASLGVLDVLDHATATNGFGGKLAIDLTDVKPVDEIVTSPRFCELNDVEISLALVERWSTMVLYADPDASVDIESMGVEGVNFVALFDRSAVRMNPYDLLWLATANTDPRRDVRVSSCGVMFIDARSKKPGAEGAPARFPNVVTSIPETIELVDRRWSEYGLGEFIESPSRHYRDLLLSDKEDW